ncbi:unnamed protein product, partial [Ectocarpus sp. 12 AP-2014]
YRSNVRTRDSWTRTTHGIGQRTARDTQQGSIRSVHLATYGTAPNLRKSAPSNSS